jgi:hypothetical protein
LRLTALVAVVAACFPAHARAQAVISAVPGLVHYSEGSVFIGGRPLLFDPTHFIHLKAGERLRTGERGRVELMLVPDVLVRLDGGAEVEMLTARLTDALIRLSSGSCTVEVRRRSAGPAAQVLLENAKVSFERDGLYRLTNALDKAAVEVFRGRARVYTQQQSYALKPNRILKWPGDWEKPQVEKLDRVEFALLDEWMRVGDTGQRLATLGQTRQSAAAVLPARLPCRSGRTCRITGLDCVLPRPVNRPVIAFTGPHISGPGNR